MDRSIRAGVIRNRLRNGMDITTDSVDSQQYPNRIGSNSPVLPPGCLRNSLVPTILGGMRFKDKLAKLLHDRGLTQAALERFLGLPENRVSKWNKTGEPSAFEVVRIARFLNVPSDWLADDELDALPNAAEEKALVAMFRHLEISLETALEGMSVAAKLSKPTQPIGPMHPVNYRDETATDPGVNKSKPRRSKVKPKSKNERT